MPPNPLQEGLEYANLSLGVEGDGDRNKPPASPRPAADSDKPPAPAPAPAPAAQSDSGCAAQRLPSPVLPAFAPGSGRDLLAARQAGGGSGTLPIHFW